jgi:hypothetical protein
MEGINKIILLLVIVFLLIGCSHTKWSKTNKVAFGTVCVAQTLDGLTTAHQLNENNDNYIAERWCWKYGTERPNAETLWAVKAVELGACWIIANQIRNEKWRNIFLWGVSGLLFTCAISNNGSGIGFHFDY